MKLTLREKKNKNYTSIYIDVYIGNGEKRKAIFLDYKLINNPKSKEEKQHNKELRKKAKIHLRNKEIDFHNRELGIPNHKPENSFFDFANQFIYDRTKVSANPDKFNAALIQVKRFADQRDVKFSDITENWLSNFKSYLMNVAVRKDGKRLSRNTAALYFRKIKRLIHTAHRENILHNNPAKNVDGIKEVRVDRPFLEISELKRLISGEEWKESEIKRAFIFACFTGLRSVDIKALKWNQIKYSEEKGHYINYTQQKTKQFDRLYISQKVFNLINDYKSDSIKVFRNLPKNEMNKITSWIKDSGIDKHITFHCSRHTNATLLLNNGADLYTVSKILGHKNIATTELYLHIVDDKLFEASKLIPNLFENEL
jgi:integrase